MIDEYTTTSMFTSTAGSKKYFWWSLIHKMVVFNRNSSITGLHANEVI